MPRALRRVEFTTEPKNYILVAGEKGHDFREAWPKVVEVVKRHVDANFQRGGPPDGQAWAPSKRVLRSGGLTLVRTGRLRRSIGSVVLATELTLNVGTNVEYADELSRGAAVFPPRPFLVIGEAAVEEISEIMIAHILGEL